MNTQRMWVTGASGFVGRHVLGMRTTLADEYGIELFASEERLQLLDPASIRRELATVNPTVVLHLAGQSNVPAAFAEPSQTLGINVLGTQHLIDGLRAMPRPARLIYVSSGDVYGRVAADQLPINEGHAPQPRNPYAVSKRAAELLVQQWCLSHGLDAVIARPFNHIGAGQAVAFAIAGFAQQIAAIAQGLQPPQIDVGDLSPTRDFTDVRDVVRAYATLATQGEQGGLYNICSGVETPLAWMLDTLIALSGHPVTVRVDASRLRPNEQPRAVGDPTRMRALGWQPRYSLTQSLEAVLHDAQQRLTTTLATRS